MGKAKAADRIPDIKTAMSLLKYHRFDNDEHLYRDDLRVSVSRIEQALRGYGEWQPIETAPKDGTEVIFWVSSEGGFPDQVANFYYLPSSTLNLKLGRKEGWYWSDSEDPLKRPDLVKGWMLYPQPPANGGAA